MLFGKAPANVCVAATDLRCIRNGQAQQSPVQKKLMHTFEWSDVFEILLHGIHPNFSFGLWCVHCIRSTLSETISWGMGIPWFTTSVLNLRPGCARGFLSKPETCPVQRHFVRSGDHCTRQTDHADSVDFGTRQELRRKFIFCSVRALCPNLCAHPGLHKLALGWMWGPN